MSRIEARAELWLVRHGETVGGSSTRLYGSTDLALSDVGRRQMERVRDALAGIAFDRVVASPLLRSREAARLVHPAPHPPAEVLAPFAEIDFGDWEGLTAGEIAQHHPLDHQRWRSADGDWGFPGGETRAGFRARVAAAVAEELAGERGRTLLVLHKGVVKIILGTLLGESTDVYSVRPCELGSVHILVREGRAWRMPRPPMVEHLGEDRLAASR